MPGAGVTHSTKSSSFPGRLRLHRCHPYHRPAEERTGLTHSGGGLAHCRTRRRVESLTHAALAKSTGGHAISCSGRPDTDPSWRQSSGVADLRQLLKAAGRQGLVDWAGAHLRVGNRPAAVVKAHGLADLAPGVPMVTAVVWATDGDGSVLQYRRGPQPIHDEPGLGGGCSGSTSGISGRGVELLEVACLDLEVLVLHAKCPFKSMPAAAPGPAGLRGDLVEVLGREIIRNGVESRRSACGRYRYVVRLARWIPPVARTPARARPMGEDEADRVDVALRPAGARCGLPPRREWAPRRPGGVRRCRGSRPSGLERRQQVVLVPLLRPCDGECYVWARSLVGSEQVGWRTAVRTHL